MMLSNTETYKSNTNKLNTSVSSSYDTLYEKYKRCLEELCDKDRQLRNQTEFND